MSSYLQLRIGDSENPRGRALVFIHNPENNSVSSKSVNIDGAALKEALFDELLQGRIIATDLFEPSFVKVRPVKETITVDNVEEFCRKESRDLIFINLESDVLAEVLVEQMVVRYTSVYRENIYLRLLEQTSGEIFRKQPCYSRSSFYVALFKLAKYICLTARARRDNENVDMYFYADEMLSWQQELSILNFSYIKETLFSGSGKDWHDMANYVDMFYMSLKKDFPCVLSDAIKFSISKTSEEWMKEEFNSLYYEFFHALFQENYEKAISLKEDIDNFNASQSLNGCR